jgi:hypothetical protein
MAAIVASDLGGGRRPQLPPNRRHHLAQVGAQADERPAAPPEAVGDGYLGVAVALRHQVEGEDLRVVEVVEDLGVRGGGGRQRPIARLAVGEPTDAPWADEQLHTERENAVAEPALGAHAAVPPGEARSDHVVRPPREDGFDQVLQLLWRVLAIGVEKGHRHRVALDRARQADTHGGAEAAVVLVRVDERARGDGNGRRPVGRAVIHHDDLDGVPQDFGRRPTHDVADRGLLVVCGQHHHDRVGRGGSGRGDGAQGGGGHC